MNLKLMIELAIVIVGFPALIALLVGQAMKDLAWANGTPPTITEGD